MLNEKPNFSNKNILLKQSTTEAERFMDSRVSLSEIFSPREPANMAPINLARRHSIADGTEIEDEIKDVNHNRLFFESLSLHIPSDEILDNAKIRARKLMMASRSLPSLNFSTLLSQNAEYGQTTKRYKILSDNRELCKRFMQSQEFKEKMLSPAQTQQNLENSEIAIDESESRNKKTETLRNPPLSNSQLKFQPSILDVSDFSLYSKINTRQFCEKSFGVGDGVIKYMAQSSCSSPLKPSSAVNSPIKNKLQSLTKRSFSCPL